MLNDILCLSTGTLSSIPTALTRWTDECKVLDAESMHDCVAGRLDSKALGFFFSRGMQVAFFQPDNINFLLLIFKLCTPESKTNQI